MKRSKVLLVDDSRAFLEMMSTVLAPHCAEVVTAANVSEGKAQLDQSGNIHIVLADVTLPDGNGFDVLAHVQQLEQVPKPRVILMTARPEADHSARARSQGAIGFLVKPFSVHDVSEVLRRQLSNWRGDRTSRRRLLGKAIVRDKSRADRPVVTWDVRDVSITGVFMEAGAPVPEGTELTLTLMLDGVTLDAKGAVVRVQEPTWSTAAGVGVWFTDLSEDSRKALERYIDEGREFGATEEED